ncbi:MAG: hypothetical protein NUW01_14365 [Gemmatimonadaceae bacterium]|nr:hypothetical protein [Gemmatimonadaceae bacterium]
MKIRQLDDSEIPQGRSLRTLWPPIIAQLPPDGRPIAVDIEGRNPIAARSGLFDAARRRGLKISVRTLATGELAVNLVPNGKEAR